MCALYFIHSFIIYYTILNIKLAKKYNKKKKKNKKKGYDIIISMINHSIHICYGKDLVYYTLFIINKTLNQLFVFYIDCLHLI